MLDIQTAPYGPLTTVFTPPSSCLTFRAQRSTIGPDGSSYSLYRQPWGFDCTAVQTNSSWSVRFTKDSACFPSSTIATSDDFGYQGIYSPGLTCPFGWTAACVVPQTGERPPFDSSPALYRLWGVLKTSETFIGCCPPEYNCNSFNNIYNGGLACGTVTVQGITSVQFYDSQCSATPEAVIMDNNTFNNAILLPAIHIIIPSGSTFGKLPPATAITTSAITSPSLSSNVNADSSSESAVGLSLRAKVAIGIVVPAMAIAIILAVGFCLMRRRAMQQQTQREERNVPELHMQTVPELPEGKKAPLVEISDNTHLPAELPVEHHRQELHGNTLSKELQHEKQLVEAGDLNPVHPSGDHQRRSLTRKAVPK